MSDRAFSGGQRPVLRLDTGSWETIRRHLESSYPEEACGGMLSEGHRQAVVQVSAAVPVENERRDERSRRYLIGPEDVMALERTAEREGLRVVGYYHSHPDAPPRPSDYDREHAWPWYIYLIVSVREGRVVEARAWRLLEDRSGFEGVEIPEADDFTS